MIDNNKTKTVVDNNSSGKCSACKRDITEINNNFIVEENTIITDQVSPQTDTDLFD